MMNWKKQPPRGDTGPGPLWGHSLNAGKDGGVLYVFGGSRKNGERTNLLHILYPGRLLWREPVTRGRPPTPRNHHSCTLVGESLFIFGGTDGINTFGDYHALDVGTHIWTQPLITGTNPEPREGHSAAYVDKKLIIFGGSRKCGNSLTYHDDLFILDASCQFTTWSHVVATATTPSKRANHTCSSWKHQFIVIGGIDSSNNFLSDVHVLNVDTLTWRELKTTGQLLPPRACHSTVVSRKYMIVFGGISAGQNVYGDVHLLDVEKLTWTKIVTSGEGPSPRFSLAGDFLAPVSSNRGAFAFYGGCNKHGKPLGDLYYLETDEIDEQSLTKQLESKQDIAINQPMPICTSTSTGSQNLLSSEELPSGKRGSEAIVTNTLTDQNDLQTVTAGPFHGLFSFRTPTSPIMGADMDNRKFKVMKTTVSSNPHSGSSICVSNTDVVMQASDIQGELKGSGKQFEVPDVELNNLTIVGSSMTQENQSSQPGLKVYMRQNKKTQKSHSFPVVDLENPTAVESSMPQENQSSKPELKVYVRREKKT